MPEDSKDGVALQKGSQQARAVRPHSFGDFACKLRRFKK
jgi:hypothetical protein